MSQPYRRAAVLVILTILLLLTVSWVAPVRAILTGERPGVTLLSAVVFFPEKRDVPVPDRMSLKFYLKERAQVNVAIRSLDPTKYYRYDICKGETLGSGYVGKVWPAGTSRPRWPDMKVYLIGALATIQKGSDPAHDWIAPVILYRSRAPSRIEAYNFTFWSSQDAAISATLQRESGGIVPGSHFPGQVQPMRILAERPLTIFVDCADLSANAYKLVLNIRYTSGASAVRVVHFYHSPGVPKFFFQKR